MGISYKRVSWFRPAQGNRGFHLLALAIVIVWGTTFVSTKVLLVSGLGPADIMLFRFILAYLCILLFSKPFRLFADNARDEFACMLSGVFGGTLYFITENSALEYTMVSNVALICSTTPLITLLLQHLYRRKKPDWRLLAGSLIAFTGVGAVVLNGHFVLEISPVGDMLCFASALSWSLYTFVSKYLSERYPAIFIVRKTFFYGIVSLVPFGFFGNMMQFDPSILTGTVVWTQLLFLGIVASFLCFMLWNVCMKRVNTVILSNYIYLIPVISIITSNLILDESIGWVIVSGTLLVILGMYTAGHAGKGG